MDKLPIPAKQLVFEDFLLLEGIKTLRSNLIFSGADKRILGLTSCSPSEGKSTLSFQLAAAFAQLDKQVLLLDVDLRKSTLARKLGLPREEKGVSHFLSGQSSLEEILLHTDIPGLQIACAGKLVPNAAELLSGQIFRDMLEQLRLRYDYIIVDTPPLGQVIDCAVIAAALDGIVLLLDATANSGRAAARVKEQIETAGGKVLGVALNKVALSRSSSKYNYYGGDYSH